MATHNIYNGDMEGEFICEKCGIWLTGTEQVIKVEGRDENGVLRTLEDIFDFKYCPNCGEEIK